MRRLALLRSHCCSEVRSLATALASLEQQLCRLLEGRGTQAGVAPSKAALCTLHMACYVACHCSMQVRLQLVEVGARLLLFASLMVLAGTSFADRAAGRLVAMHLMAAQTLLEMIVSEPGEGPCELYDAAQQAFRPDLTVKWLLRLTAYLAEAGAGSERANAGQGWLVHAGPHVSLWQRAPGRRPAPFVSTACYAATCMSPADVLLPAPRPPSCSVA